MRSALLFLVTTTLLAQTPQTKSTMCGTTEFAAIGGATDRLLTGCGEGFSTNLLWHLDQSDSASGSFNGTVTRSTTGRGVVVYVIDTGVWRSHDEFVRAAGPNVSAGINTGRETASCPNEVVEPCTLSQLIGHGTGVGSIIAGRHTGVAPDASLVAIFQAGTAAAYVTLLKQIVEHAYLPTTPSFQTAIINHSGGLIQNEGDSPELDALIRRMIAGVDANANADPNGKKFLFVTLTGNSYPGQTFDQCGPNKKVILYPAVLGPSTDGVITVGGTTRENQYWDGACRDGAEMAAPAHDVFVASSSTNASYRYKPDISAHGTSWAAPFVSGMAARLLESDPSRTPVQLEQLLKASPFRVDGLPVPVIVPVPDVPNATGPRRRSARH